VAAQGHITWGKQQVWLLIVEALIALGMFVFIVWWTVRSRHEPPPHDALPPDAAAGEKAQDESAKKDGDKSA
jgi:hypothetical protein